MGLFVLVSHRVIALKRCRRMETLQQRNELVKQAKEKQFIAVEAIMEVDVVEVIEMELKYCERCGGLWLRARGEAEVYCASCAPKMAEFPVARKRRQAHVSVTDSVAREGCCDELFAVCCEGGNA